MLSSRNVSLGNWIGGKDLPLKLASVAGAAVLAKLATPDPDPTLTQP